MVLHDKYVSPGEAREWVPINARGQLQVPVLVLSREVLKNLDINRMAFLKGLSWFLREPVTVTDFDFSATYNGKPALAFYV